MTDRELMQQALEALRNAEVVHMEQLNAMYALQEALAQPEQEPVAWIHELADGHRHCVTNDESGYVDNFTDTYKTIPLYTAPPKREWVGLTDDEIKEIVGPWGDTPIKGYTRKLFDQIEAKLREKNQ